MTEERKNIPCCLKWRAFNYCAMCGKQITPRTKPDWYIKTPRLPDECIGTKSAAPKTSRSGRVYFVRSGETNCIKVGQTADTVPKRISGFQTGNPEVVTIIKYVESSDYILLEKRLHAFLAELGLHYYLEWYLLDEDDINMAISVCYDWSGEAYRNAQIDAKAASEMATINNAFSELPYNLMMSYIRIQVWDYIASLPRVEVDAKPAEIKVLSPTQQIDELLSSHMNFVGDVKSMIGVKAKLIRGEKYYEFKKDHFHKYCRKLSQFPVTKENLHYVPIPSEFKGKFIISLRGQTAKHIHDATKVVHDWGHTVDRCMLTLGGTYIVTNKIIEYGLYADYIRKFVQYIGYVGPNDLADEVEIPPTISSKYLGFELTFTVYDCQKNTKTITDQPVTLSYLKG